MNIDATSPCLAVDLIVAERFGLSVLDAMDVTDAYSVTGNDGIRRFRAESDLPDWLLDAIRRSLRPDRVGDR